jgi:ribosome-associated translation inhibitor RaiA
MSDQVVHEFDANASGAAAVNAGSAIAVTSVEAPVTMAFVSRGNVPREAATYARQRIGTVLARIAEPVLSARVKLTKALDPALERPAIAQVTVDIDGDIVRAHIGAHEMYEAIDLLRARLRDKLEHRAQHRQALRHRPAASPPGEWRHGDPPAERPGYFDRPPEERELVRRKIQVTDELTPDEAAFDMEQLDFDFYLFRDLASGKDAALERLSDGSYLMTRVRPTSIDTGPTSVALEIAERPASQLRLDQAIERITAGGERFVFFENAATGRGNVVYHRYDGHYGLIAPE